MESETRVNSSKKLARLEKKKKKMIAFLEIAKLNDHDRAQRAKNDVSSEDEPSSKKVKTEHNTIIDPVINNEMDKKVEKKFVTGEEYEKLRKELKERKARLKNLPNFKLKSVGEEASILVSPENRTPLFLSDMQHLILFALLGIHSPCFPSRWSMFEKQSRLKHTVVLIVENLSLYHYTSNQSSFNQINSFFSNKLELVTPSIYRGDLIEEIAAVPLTTTQKDKLIEEYGSLEIALRSTKVFKMLKAVFPVQESNKELVSNKNFILPPHDKFPRTHLLLSASQLVEENYPLPLKGSLKQKYSSYILTKDCYEDVTANSPMFAIDCEMCKTTTGELELTRVSVVSENHKLIYEKLVKPYNRIIDYLTRFSGITAEMLKSVTTRIEHVQKELRELLPADAILVGQSLNSDLHALKMMHPYIIDSSVVFNVTGDRYRKTKLKILAKEFLDETIQQGNSGHDSIEDSLSALKLVQLKLRHYIEFGDAVLSGQKGYFRDYRMQDDNYYGSSLLHHVTKVDKKAVVIAKPANISRYNKFIHKKDKKVFCMEKDTNKSIIKEICERSKHYDLTIGHISLTKTEISPDNLEESCHNVDKLLQRLCASVPACTLCVLLFGGDAANNGVCFVQIKKDSRK